MSEVPERDAVDRCFASAEAKLRDAHDQAAGGAQALAVVMVGEAIVKAIEGLARQVRDADDTIATVLVPAFREELNDLIQKVDMTGGSS